jgi:hypothetical protein
MQTFTLPLRVCYSHFWTHFTRTFARTFACTFAGTFTRIFARNLGLLLHALYSHFCAHFTYTFTRTCAPTLRAFLPALLHALFERIVHTSRFVHRTKQCKCTQRHTNAQHVQYAAHLVLHTTAIWFRSTVYSVHGIGSWYFPVKRCIVPSSCKKV